jgi:hypothetical protein
MTAMIPKKTPRDANPIIINPIGIPPALAPWPSTSKVGISKGGGSVKVGIRVSTGVIKN